MNVTLTYNNGWRILCHDTNTKALFPLRHESSTPGQVWEIRPYNKCTRWNMNRHVAEQWKREEACTDAQKRAERDAKRLKPWDFDFMPLVSKALPITLSAKKELLTSISSTLSHLLLAIPLFLCFLLCERLGQTGGWLVVGGWGRFTVSGHVFAENQVHDLGAASAMLHCLHECFYTWKEALLPHTIT